MLTSSSFRSLVKDYLAERYDESPTWASTLGLTEYDERSEDLSAEAFRRRDARVLEWAGRFRALPESDIDRDERIDRAVVLSSLRGRELTQPRQDWKRQPNTYLNPSLQGVFTLFLHRLRPERDLALTPRVYVDRAVGQAKAAARYARELVPAEIADPTTRQRVAAAGARAAVAYDDFAAFLDSNKVRASGDYAVGEELY